jgi:DNA-binding response OmpR family regulator
MARDLVAQRKFNVVLLDLKLPEGTGKDVLARVREANPEARTIIITGHRRELESLIDEVLADGADAICYKPFDVRQLLGTIDQLSQEQRKTS